MLWYEFKIEMMLSASPYVSLSLPYVQASCDFILEDILSLFCKISIPIHAIIVTVAIHDRDAVSKNFRRKDEKREELRDGELSFFPSCGTGACRIPMVHFLA